ncbi:TraB/GumN family protein [Corallincola platygyrae]|uniref:TraB/GumN family protein n=1 Tax=Corallincola platygyrae TaxID=1193278 RepID=A0ABW4XH55_9GAMM
MRLWIKSLLLFVAIFSAPLSATISPALYEVTKGNQTSYFFGSVHMGEARYYPLPAAIEKRFSQADQLVMEVNMQDEAAIQAEMMQLMMLHGMYMDGTTLKQHLPKALYKETVERAKRFGVPSASIDPLKPWAAALILAQAYYQSIGLDPNYGVDMYFSGLAKQKNKSVYGLETLTDQISAMMKLDAEGSTMLQQMLDETKSNNSYTQRMMRAWAAGDSKLLASIFKEELGDTKADQLFVDHLLKKRNQAWLKQLKPMMSKSSLFVVVGAAHLVGPENLLDSLSANGYKVSKLAY